MESSTQSTPPAQASIKPPEPAPPTPTKKCCGGGGSAGKTIGLGSLVIAKFGGKVPAEVAEKRFEICSGCTAIDAKGDRLFREIDGVYYCGAPRLKKIVRDESIDGCGCNLKDKVLHRRSFCPLVKPLWTPYVMGVKGKEGEPERKPEYIVPVRQRTKEEMTAILKKHKLKMLSYNWPQVVVTIDSVAKKYGRTAMYFAGISESMFGTVILEARKNAEDLHKALNKRLEDKDAGPGPSKPTSCCS